MFRRPGLGAVGRPTGTVLTVSLGLDIQIIAVLAKILRQVKGKATSLADDDTGANAASCVSSTGSAQILTIVSHESARVCASMKRSLGFAASVDVLDDEQHEVLVAIADDNVFDRVGRRFPWPRSLPRRPVPLQPGPRHCHPVAEPLAGIREITVPAERGGAVLVGVEGAEPVQVERGEFPDELWVPMPEWRHDGCWQPVGASYPVHPPVEFDPFGFGVVGAEEIPVDRMWGLRRERSVEVIKGFRVERVVVVASCPLRQGLCHRCFTVRIWREPLLPRA